MALNVLSPSLNPITNGFSSAHLGYDHDDVPDKRYFASFDGKIIRVVNSYSTSWVVGNSRPLTTADYGNFLMLQSPTGDVQLAAHFPKNGILVKVGQIVKAGDMIAIPPNSSNDTGNSTGGHTHTEYRNSVGVKHAVTFIKHDGNQSPVPQEPTMNYDELGKQLEILMKRYGKGTFADFDKFLIDHIGEKGQGGYLQSERNDNQEFKNGISNLKTLLNIAQNEPFTAVINRVNELVNQSFPPQPPISNPPAELPTFEGTIPGFKLKQLVFERN